MGGAGCWTYESRVFEAGDDFWWEAGCSLRVGCGGGGFVAEGRVVAVSHFGKRWNCITVLCVIEDGLKHWRMFIDRSYSISISISISRKRDGNAGVLCQHGAGKPKDREVQAVTYRHMTSNPKRPSGGASPRL